MLRSSREESKQSQESEGNRSEEREYLSDVDTLDGIQQSKIEQRSGSLNSRDCTSTDDDTNVKSHESTPNRPQSDANDNCAQSQQSSKQQAESDSDKPKRNPFCSRCRNHGKKAQVKGHKRHCEYRNCQCKGCKLVECRQLISAAQIKSRRDQKQDEECGRRIEISPPVLVRAPETDPAALIAKTLGDPLKHSASSDIKKSLASSILASPDVASGVQVPPVLPSHHQQYQFSATGQQNPLRLGVVENLSEQRNSGATLQRGQQQFAGPQMGPPSMLNNSAVGLHQANPLYQKEQSPLAGAGPDSRSPTGPALRDAFQMFSLPKSPAVPQLNRAAHHHNQADQQVFTSVPMGLPSENFSSNILATKTSSSTANTSSSSTPISTSASALHSIGSPPIANNATTRMDLDHPGHMEHLFLAQEIHRIYGPIAIFAWFKAEHFNVDKVRSLIELTRHEYTSLVEAFPRPSLEASNPRRSSCGTPSSEQARTVKSNGTSRSDTTLSEAAGDQHHLARQTARLMRFSRDSNSANSNGGQQQERQHSNMEVHPSGRDLLADPNDSHKYPGSLYPYTLGSMGCQSGVSGGDHAASLIAAAAAAAATANKTTFDHRTMPAPMDNLRQLYHQGAFHPSGGHQEFLGWPSLKLNPGSHYRLPGLTSDQANLMHHHHIIPHFMHHQHLLAQQAVEQAQQHHIDTQLRLQQQLPNILSTSADISSMPIDGSNHHQSLAHNRAGSSC